MQPFSTLSGSFTTEDDWRHFRTFLQNLRWKLSDDACVATTELACLFWWRGHLHTQLEAGVSFYHHLIVVFRSMLKQALRLDNIQILPGDLIATTNKYCGCAFPKGIVAGVSVYMSDHERLQLVHLFDNGAGRPLNTWDVVLPMAAN